MMITRIVRPPPALVRIASVGLFMAMSVPSAHAQRVASQFTTGGRELVNLTFATVTPGTLPQGVTLLSGSVQPVTMLGQPMLRIVERTALLVKLPEVLPQNFTIEVDLIPKTCCQPEDLALEGTAVINQWENSANVLWHHELVSVIGGAVNDNPSFRLAQPAPPGTLVQVVLTMQGDNMTLFTNGQQSFALTNRKFARDTLLRVFLGGQNDQERAVYLARFRVIASSAPVGPLSGGTAPAIVTTPSSRSIALQGFVSSGVSASTTSRSFFLRGFAASGSSGAVASRTLTLSGFAGTGSSPSVPSRTLTLSGFTGAGSVATPVSSRTFTLAGFAGAGTSLPVLSRTISLGGFTAAGPAQLVPSRTITTTGFIASGTATAVATRTLPLVGWTAAGPP